LRRTIDGRSIVYLDSAATSLKPQPVINAMLRFYTEMTANVHRAVHRLSEEATEAYEGARETVARLVNADSREIAFVRNATEGINVVAHTLCDRGPVAMLLTEHHSNQLPWRTQDCLVLDVHRDGSVDLDAARRDIKARKPALLAISTISGGLGVRCPVGELTAVARSVGAAVLLDLSQSVGHEPVDLQAVDCDYACFSGHKMLAPSGIGVLYQREDAPIKVEPLLVGGSMVHAVHTDDYELRPFPWSIEAGTPNIEGAIGLGAACDYLDRVGVENIQAHCAALVDRARGGLRKIERVRLVAADEVASDSIVSFTVRGLESHGVARMLSNRYGIMIRSGYHCAQPAHEALGLGETARASVHLYNTAAEIDAFIEGVRTLAAVAS